MRVVPLLLVAALACRGAEATPDNAAITLAAPPPPAAMAEVLDTARLERALAHAAEMPRLRSLLVQWRGDLVAERYLNGMSASSPANVKSVSKSILSAVVGVAVAQGHIRSLDQPISELLPAEMAGLDSVKRGITVGDLLTMRAGLQSTSFDDYGRWVTSRNWVRHALQRPMVAEPGGPMIYSTGSSHLLSAILTHATGMSTHQYAQRHLARPLGFTLRPWARDPQGIFFGGNDMYLRPRDMLRIGSLYVNGGTYDGTRVLPGEWVDSSFVTRGYSRFNGDEYGYGWWTRRVRAQGHEIRYAWGYGGQFIYVVPSLDLVVVVTSASDTRREPGHNGQVHRLLEQQIIPAVLR